MIQALKKNAIFLFYASLNGFLTASGYTLAFTVISSNTSVLERTNIFLISSVEKINTITLTAAFICFTVIFFLLFFLRDRLYRQTLPFSVLFFLLRTDLRHNGAVISYRYSGGGCGDTGVCFQRNLSRKGI